ncbi:MAG: NF038143 family protein, partial [Dehalococcoidales bacterium]|nr:NF038143 family protein [Dehalococcoidales bacterium]
PRQDVLAWIDDKTTNILASDKQGVYSERIRRKQMNEINLLIDHYLKLLKAEGKDYESLVKDAYQTQDNYEAFLHELTVAEKAVNRAAIQTVGKTETALELISKMETVTNEIRRKEAEEIFS